MFEIERVNCISNSGYKFVKAKTTCDSTDHKGMGKRSKDNCAEVCKKQGAKYFTYNSNGAYCNENGCLCWCQIMKGGDCKQKFWGNDDLYIIGECLKDFQEYLNVG